MKKLFITLFIFLSLIETSLLAIPAKRIVQTVTQPDGSTLSIILQGDESFHFYTTIDGVMLQKDDNEIMRYAISNAGGNFIPGKYMAHNPDLRDDAEKAYIKDINSLQIENSIAKIREQYSRSILQTTTRGKTQFPNKGTVRGLIIMAQYKDVKFAAKNTRDEFDQMMNSENYSKNGATGSARQYFMDQSSGVFTPEFDVVGPVTLPQNMAYYGTNVSFNGQDSNPGEMVKDACMAADALLNVDFSQYDFDNDDKVDLVFIIYAGYAEAQGGPASSIWPHAWTLEAAGFSKVLIDGKRINNYACSSELRGESGADMDGIGSFCHEFSHCLGLPDIYDTRKTGMFGMDAWSIMDYGNYNNGSRTPPGYSAYERYSIGWLDPVILKDPQKDIELSPINTSNKAYMLVSDTNADEYYTLENRQQSGWDRYLPGHGLMIVHVDYVQSIWDSNILNSKSAGHPHLQIVPADNEFDDLSGDMFPGPSQNTSFTDESTPAATLYTSANNLGKPISKIRETDDMILFDFMHFVGTPTATGATDISSNSFTANWTPVANATSYFLKVASCTTGRQSIKEDFSKFTEGSQSSPDTENIAGKLNDYLTTPGWSGENLFQAGGRVAVGADASAGKITTPLLDLSGEKAFTLYCKIKGSKSMYDGVFFEFLNESGKVTASKSLSMYTSEREYYWIFDSDAQKGQVRIRTKAAIYISNMSVYDGDVQELLENSEVPQVPKEYEKTFDGIAAPSYIVEGLESNKRYIYNVWAKLNEEISLISNKAILQTTPPTGIESMAIEKRNIRIEKGLLHFTCSANETYHIYAMNGITYRSDVAKEGENEVSLSSGLYILNIGTENIKIYMPE